MNFIFSSPILFFFYLKLLMIFILLKNRLPGARSVTVDFLLLLADFRQEMKGGHSQRRRFSLVKSRRETRTIVRFDKEKRKNK